MENSKVTGASSSPLASMGLEHQSLLSRCVLRILKREPRRVIVSVGFLVLCHILCEQGLLAQSLNVAGGLIPPVNRTENVERYWEDLSRSVPSDDRLREMGEHVIASRAESAGATSSPASGTRMEGEMTKEEQKQEKKREEDEKEYWGMNEPHRAPAALRSTGLVEAPRPPSVEQVSRPVNEPQRPEGTMTREPGSLLIADPQTMISDGGRSRPELPPSNEPPGRYPSSTRPVPFSNGPHIESDGIQETPIQTMSERTALILMITCGVSFIVSIISIVIAISNAKRPRFVFVGKDKPETTDIAGQAGEQSTTPGGPTTVTPPELGVRWKGTSPAATGLEADPREIPTPLRPDDVNEGSGAGAVLGGPSQGARRW